MRYRVAHRRAAKRSGLTQVLAPMKKFQAILMSAAACCASPASIACSPGPMNEQIARQLDAVLIGEVVGSTWNDANYQLLVTVKVREVLKGKGPTEIVAPFPCFRSVENGRRVIVLIKGADPVAWHSEYYETDIRAALRRGR